MDKTKVSLTWTKKLSDEKQKEEFVKKLYENEEILNALAVILDEKIEASRNNQLSTKSFSSPAWPYEQADSNGYQRALSEIKSLIKLEK